MRELQKLLKRFLAREIGLEEVQRGFAVLLEQDPNLAASAAAWLDAGERDGLLSSAVCTSLKNVIVSHLATIAVGVDPRASGVFEISGELSDSRTLLHPKERQPLSGDSQKTRLATSQGSRSNTESIVRNLEDPKTELAGQTDKKVDTVLKIGSVVGNRYELLAQLGRGGMGTVYKARDRLRVEAQDRKPFVALKVLSDKFKEHPDSMIALQREARRAQSLAHPNVITVHEFFRDGPHLYMTMELLDGQPLDRLLRTELAGGLPIDKAWPIIESVGKALQYGHENGIVHSDIKPGNIFVCSNSTVKVLDFGISRPIPLSDVPDSEQTVFDARKRLGSLTPSYASLEMWYQDTPDARDDIYSLACVAYLLLSGRHPFDGSSAKTAYEKKLKPEKIASITRGQWAAVAGGLKLRRHDRIDSVTKFLGLLAPVNVTRSRRRVAALAGLLLLVATSGVAVRYYGIALEDQLLTDRGQMTRFDSTKPVEPADLTPEQQEEIRGLIELAKFELEGVGEKASAAELDYVLLSGPNNVIQLLDSVTDLNPADEAALTLRREVFNLYTHKASEFIAGGDYESAMLMSQNAEAVIPNTGTVLRLTRSICDRAPKICGR